MPEQKMAYVCRECGEAFLPEIIQSSSDWPALRRDHKVECPDATFKRVTEDEAF